MQPDMSDKLQERLKEILQVNNEMIKSNDEVIGGPEGENGENALSFADNIMDKNFQEEMEYLAS